MDNSRHQHRSREAWRCSYKGASGKEVSVHWYESKEQRDAYLEMAPSKGDPIAVRYVSDPSINEAVRDVGLTSEDLDALENYLIAPDCLEYETHARFVSNHDMRKLLSAARSLLRQK